MFVVAKLNNKFERLNHSHSICQINSLAPVLPMMFWLDDSWTGPGKEQKGSTLCQNVPSSWARIGETLNKEGHDHQCHLVCVVTVKDLDSKTGLPLWTFQNDTLNHRSLRPTFQLWICVHRVVREQSWEARLWWTTALILFLWTVLLEKDKVLCCFLAP